MKEATMVDRSVSWTDAESVAALLARATAPRRVQPLNFGFANGGAKANLRSPPAPAPPPATVVAAPRPKSLAPSPAPKLEQTSDNPSDRLDALLAWTLDHHRCTGAFVADDNGLTLAAHGISEAHVSLVGPLLSALVGVRSIPGIDATAGALWLGSNMMSWVEARTERGGFCLGAVGSEPLSTRAFEQFKEALEVTVRGL
jgi:hypothetical protein